MIRSPFSYNVSVSFQINARIYDTACNEILFQLNGLTEKRLEISRRKRIGNVGPAPKWNLKTTKFQNLALYELRVQDKSTTATTTTTTGSTSTTATTTTTTDATTYNNFY